MYDKLKCFTEKVHRAFNFAVKCWWCTALDNICSAVLEGYVVDKIIFLLANACKGQNFWGRKHIQIDLKVETAAPAPVESGLATDLEPG